MVCMVEKALGAGPTVDIGVSAFAPSLQHSVVESAVLSQ